LTADRAYSENSSEQYSVISGNYTPLSPYSYGMFSISTVLVKTAFSKSDESGSAAFDDFRANRIIVANRLATQRGIDLNNPGNIDADGFPIGYGKIVKQYCYLHFWLLIQVVMPMMCRQVF